MATVVMTARVDEEKRKKVKRILDNRGMTFTSYVNDSLDSLIENNGLIQEVNEDNGKSEQEKMIDRINRPENREKIRYYFENIMPLQSKRPLTKYDTMSNEEIAIEKAKARGVI